MSTDYPGLAYIQAEGFTAGRPDGPPLWIVLHTMESHELAETAEATARYFANPGDGRSVSSHLCIDANSAVQCVRVKDSAWTVGNRAGNRRGLNYELAGRASQGPAGWADAYSQAMLRRAAKLAAIDAKRFSIPLSFRSVADLRALKKGFTTHNDLRLAFGVTTHTDPGSAFPRSDFLTMVRAEMGTPAPAPTAPSGGLPFYRNGTRELKLTSPQMKGTDVLFVQKFIERISPDDGIFGPDTKEGVVWYQKMRGLRPDGIVGPVTWRNMGVSV